MIDRGVVGMRASSGLVNCSNIFMFMVRAVLLVWCSELVLFLAWWLM